MDEALRLEPVDILRADYFTERREVGIINVGGAGTVTVEGETYTIGFKEALYIGRGNQEVVFRSDDKAAPAKFYFNSAPAHTAYPTTKVTREKAVILELGSLEESNHRVINRMIVQEVLPTCQLQMGMTELKPGSVWNTMPPHTHDRRMEAYFYFDLPGDAGRLPLYGANRRDAPHLVEKRPAVISPSWCDPLRPARR